MRAVCYLRKTADLTFEAQHRAFLDDCRATAFDAGPVFTETAPADQAPEFRRMLRALLALEGDSTSQPRRSEGAPVETAAP